MPDRPSSAAADAAASASPPSSGSLNSSASPRAKRLMDEEFVDTQHLTAFAKALSAPDVVAESVSASPTTPSSHVVSPPATEQGDPFPKGVEKLRAVSDFAPIHTKVKKRSRTKLPTRKEGISYHLARYPLLILLLAVIAFEFSFYVGTRQLVNIFEFLVAWTGHKRVLRQKLRNARTYEEWKQAALDMDEYLGFNLWKSEDEDSQYDWGLVRKVKRSLLTLREANDVRGVIGVLEVCLRPNFAGIERVQMYSETFYGSKMLIESYIDEVQRALRFVRESTDATLEEKKKFFKSANKNFGSSALCLSGGASFGYYHFGVVSAFLKSGTIPRVVTGTSAGALVAAMITTRTDDELRQLIVPELADHITACEEGIQIWLKRFWKTGARFDTLKWAEKATFFTRGSLTFREAYERTGRVLNVSVVPLDRHSPTKLLNYLTAPDCVIWSAIIASAAVPGILNPVVLMKKRKSGEIEPWSWGARFKDGSLRVDIPLQSLHLLFNVNYSIVSQVNPHVHLFFFAPKGTAGRPVAHRKGKGWRGGFLLSAMEQYLKLELTKNFKVIRDLELMPIMLGQDWSSVFLQRFDGSITIWPRTRFQDWIHILTDPDRQELARMIRVGELVTWPKLHMISNRERLEREILQGRRDVHIALGRERTINDTSSQSNDPVAPPNIRAGSSTLSIPIESDAERGFERQSLKYVAKRNGTNGKGIGQSRELPAVESSGGERRLPFILPGDGAPRRRSRSARPAVSTDDSDDEEEASHPSSSDEKHPGANSGRGFSPMQTLGSSFRQIRTQSFPTFQIPWGSSALTSPRSRAMDIASNLPPTKGQGGRSRRRSGGYSAHHSQRQTSDSSSSEDADELMDWGRVSGDSAGRGWRDTSGAEAGRSLKRA